MLAGARDIRPVAAHHEDRPGYPAEQVAAYAQTLGGYVAGHVPEPRVGLQLSYSIEVGLRHHTHCHFYSARFQIDSGVCDLWTGGERLLSKYWYFMQNVYVKYKIPHVQNLIL